MSKKPSETITDAEWEVMRVVWAKSETTSKEIITVLERKKVWKPSTVKTLLARLVIKGYLDTQKDGKQLIYHAVIQEDDVIREMRKEFLSKVCNQKISMILLETILEEELSIDDIKRLEITLEKKKKTAKKVVLCNCLPGQCHCKK